MRLPVTTIAFYTRLLSASMQHSSSPIKVATTERGLIGNGLQFIATEQVGGYDSLVLGRPEGGPLSLFWGGSAGVKEKPFFIDFEATLSRRASLASSELVVKAMGKPCGVVWDLTAGLGRDAFLLAAAGHTVHLYERNPILHALLHNALQRLTISNSADVSKRLFLHPLIDSCSVTILSTDLPDCVYLDPMYPAGTIGKKSNVKKETQMLRRLVGDLEREDIENNIMLLKKALSIGKRRIVVKRPLSAEALVLSEGPLRSQPISNFAGSGQRFDIYLPQQRP